MDISGSTPAAFRSAGSFLGGCVRGPGAAPGGLVSERGKKEGSRISAKTRLSGVCKASVAKPSLLVDQDPDVLSMTGRGWFLLVFATARADTFGIFREEQ
jgi:hypothetical protein